MPRKLSALSALSLAALRGPLLHSSIRFEGETVPPAPVVPPAPAAPVTPPPAAVPPPPAAPAAAAPPPGPMQQLRALWTERASAIAERDTTRQQLTAVTAERDTARTQLAAVTAQRDALAARETAIAQREQAHSAAATQLAADRTDFDRMVSDGVINAQAAAGVPAAALPASSPVPAAETPREIWTRWESLTGAAKTTYYRAHEAVLEKPRPKDL